MEDKLQLFNLYCIFLPLVLLIGFYCIIVTRNLIRALIGLEILTKAVTILIILGGYLTNQLALAQSLVITLIVIEVVVIAVAAGLIVNIFNCNNSLDARKLTKLKG